MATPVPKDQGERSAEQVKPLSAEEKERIRQEIWKMRRAITKGGRFRTIAGVMAKHGLLYFSADGPEHVSLDSGQKNHAGG